MLISFIQLKFDVCCSTLSLDRRRLRLRRCTLVRHYRRLLCTLHIHATHTIVIQSRTMSQIPPESLTLQHFNGTISLVFPSVDKEGHVQHITLLTPGEYKSIDRPPLSSISISLEHVYILGQGRCKRGEVRWEVIIWNHGNQWRKSHGLPPKDFHITLSDVDDWDVDKGIGSAINTLGVDEVVARAKGLGEVGTDHAIVACGEDHLHLVRPRLALYTVISDTNDPVSAGSCRST